MCGIAGIVGNNHNIKQELEFINKSIIHRGPDDKGFYYDRKYSLGLTSTRLSIIGLKEGSQPKISKDKKAIVFFNGEIFNYKELIKKYLKKKDKIKSDTEVILELYLKFGISFLKKLNGMFAISIYDKKKKLLYLIKDRFGIKPLYYSTINKKIIFSSEINSILNLTKNKKSLNSQAVSNYLTMGFINSPNTIYQDIYKIEPATYLKLNVVNLKIIKKKWWSINKKKKIINKKDDFLSKKIENQIIKSVKLWSVSDVPVSFLLSGGLDSALISAIYSKNSKKDLSTYSYVFNKKKYERWDESKNINDFLERYKSKHQNYFFEQSNFTKELIKILSHLGEPFGGGLPSWYLLKEVSKKHKVVLTGVGGDELFGNYNRPYKILKTKKNCYNFDNFKKYYFYKFYLADYSFKKKFTYLNLSKLEDPSLKYFNQFKARKKNFSKINNLSLIDIDLGLTDDYLYYNDRFSMAHSVELRTPYLDHELVELMFQVPPKKKFNSLIYKPLLRTISKKYLPDSYFEQKKKGFTVPLSEIMRKGFKKKVLYYLSKIQLKKVGIIKPIFYDEFVKPLLKGNNENITLIWHVLMFQIWYLKIFNKQK